MTKPQNEISGRDLLSLRYLRDKYGVAAVIRAVRELPPRRRGAPRKLRSGPWLVSTVDAIVSKIREKEPNAPKKKALLEVAELERADGHPVSPETLARRYRRHRSELARLTGKRT